MKSDRGIRFSQILFALYFLEAGAFLCLAPWSPYWTRRVASSSERVQIVLISPFFRGFVTGLGLLHIAVGIRELDARRRAGGIA